MVIVVLIWPLGHKYKLLIAQQSPQFRYEPMHFIKLWALTATATCEKLGGLLGMNTVFPCNLNILLAGWELNTLFVLQSKVHACEINPRRTMCRKLFLPCFTQHSMATAYAYEAPLLTVISLPCTHMIGYCCRWTKVKCVMRVFISYSVPTHVIM